MESRTFRDPSAEAVRTILSAILSMASMEFECNLVMDGGKKESVWCE